MIVARQSTARTVTVGPVLDASGVAVTDCVVADFEGSVNGGDPAALNGSATLTHRGVGFYSLALTATDLATVGTFEVVINDTVNACPMKEITVIEEAVYDALFAASAPGYLQPTTAGRTLDVTATGAAGIDWGNVENPTTAVNLSATNIDADQVVASVSGAVGSVTGDLGGNVLGSVGAVAAGGITAASIADAAIDTATFATGATIPRCTLVDTATTVTNQLTAAQIATGVWQDATAGDFTAAGSIGKSLFTSGVVPGAAGGLFIAGSNAATTFASITCTGTFTISDGLVVSRSTTNTHAISATGNGTGSGVYISSGSGAIANAMTLESAATNGQGLYAAGRGLGSGISAISGFGATAHAIQAISYGTTGSGLRLYGNGTGHGLHASGGDTGTGMTLEGGGTSGAGMVITTTSGDGLSITPTAGNAITATANGTSKHGLVVTGGTAGTSDGLKAVAGTGGVPIRGDITGNITGNLSGSANSVTTGVTVTTNNDKTGYSLTVTPPTAAEVATAVWTDTTAGDFTTTSSPGKILVAQLGGTFTTTSSSVYSSAALANAPTGGSAPTAAQVATAVWQDTTAGDFTVAGSIGKSLFTSGNAPGAASGLALVGSNMGTVSSVTTGVTVTTNNDKTGYSLTQAFPSNFSALSISAGGVVDANEKQILGTALTETSAGYLAAAYKTLFDVAVPVLTSASVNQTGDSYARIGATGSGLTSLAPSATALSTATWTGALATNLGTLASHDPGATLASQTNITAGTITTVTNLTNKGDGSGFTAIPWNAAWGTDAQAAAAAALSAYDPPTNAEMEARTLAAAGYATAANQTTIAGYLDTEVAAILAAVDTEVAAIKTKTDNLPAAPAAVGDIPTVAQIWTTALTEAYRSAGAAGTAAQLLHEILQNLTEFAISGTTKTVKKFNGSDTAKTYTLNSATTPTAITETT